MTRKKQYPAIKYTSRDFNSIKQDLVEYAKRYYPHTFKDFSESGFGSMMLDTVAYVGDILSFYLDYEVNETFLDTSIEYNNVLRLGKQMGFKFKGVPISRGLAEMFIIIPANSRGDQPDPDYIPILKKGSVFSSDDGIAFTLNEDVNFADPDNETVVAAVNSDNGNIISYAIKAVGEVISGQRYEEKVIVGDFQKFLRVKLAGSNISEILSVEDDLGNEYYEVDYLSQDVVYRDLINNGANKKTTPNVLRPLAVPRRFTSELMEGETYLQFGFGSEKDVTVDPLLDPSKTILKVHGKDYFSDVSFDPSNLVSTDKFGVAPSNTTLTIGYLANTLSEVNIAAGGLSNVVGPLFEFGNINTLVNSKVSDVINSMEVNNQETITGDVTYPSIDELKERIYNVFASQNRAVTALDYKSMCYAMPTKYGAIKRANVIKDPGSLKRNLNVYVLSEDVDGNFITANSTIKENLKHWLNQGRMINDTVDIIDAKVINVGIEFDAISTPESNPFEVLNEAAASLSVYYERKFEIGEPFYIGEIFSHLNRSPGILDVTRVKVTQKTGLGYSNSVLFNVDDNMSVDDRYIVVPNNAVLEIKYPSQDIKGSIR
tara:strand:+ start:1155 stop:2957 length:1803 start_codon:yes stop_codon:yes gene_type:complete